MELLRRWVVARLRRRIRELFRHLYLRQVEHLQPWQQQRATMPLVLYCSHNGWSDVALAIVLSYGPLHLPSLFLVTPHQLEHFSILRYCRAVALQWNSTEELELQLPALLQRIRPGSVLWVFATGEYLSAGATEALLGCAQLVQRLKHPVAMAPVAWHYRLLQEEPACYIWFGTPERFEPPDGALGPLVQHCSRRLQELYQRQQLELYTAPPSGAYQRYRL